MLLQLLVLLKKNASQLGQLSHLPLYYLFLALKVLILLLEGGDQPVYSIRGGFYIIVSIS